MLRLQAADKPFRLVAQLQGVVMPSSSSRSTPAPGRLLSLRRLRQLPYLVHVILLGTLLSRFAFFMVWPYLGLMLYRQFALSATDSGLILALSSGCST